MQTTASSAGRVGHSRTLATTRAEAAGELWVPEQDVVNRDEVFAPDVSRLSASEILRELVHASENR